MMHEPNQELRMHSLILGSMLLIMGYQTLLSGLYVGAFGKSYGVAGEGGLGKRLASYHSLEKELVIGGALLVGGVVLGSKVIFSWIDVGFGSLQEVQEAMMAMILSIMGLQTIFSAIIISLLLLRSENGNGYR
ncbi:MAG: glycosyltransferase family 2 protein, partial [Methanothrix sp.]|nr:glycosyltransferase family 2 protein [Methanothrix sp.]